MTFPILSTHFQLGHSVPSSMWTTQHYPDKPCSVFTFQPHTFTLSDSLQCVWLFLSQALFSALGLFVPIDPLPTFASHPLALDTKASCTFPISSSWCCPCLDHTSGCISCFFSSTLASVSANPQPTFGNPDPALESSSHRGPISWAKIFAWSVKASSSL